MAVFEEKTDLSAFEENVTGAQDRSFDRLGTALARLGVGEETLREPLRLKPFEHWVGHIPFAFWIVSALRPRILVELGTHRGNSFLAFCQAIEAEGCGTRAYAVDTWDGDTHMAREEGLFEELSAYHDPRYGHFSSLIRDTFDEARKMFPAGSIDLLHIDGTHTYEAVTQDFTTWESALSDRAVVLFHDVNVRRQQYGVWRLWNELSQRYPHFEFFHSFGLGVLGVGRDLPERLQTLFDLSSHHASAAPVRSFFAARGMVGIRRLAHEIERERSTEAENRYRLQIETQQAESDAARHIRQTEHERSLDALRAEQAAEREKQNRLLAALQAERGEQHKLIDTLQAERGEQRGLIDTLQAEREGQHRLIDTLQAECRSQSVLSNGLSGRIEALQRRIKAVEAERNLIAERAARADADLAQSRDELQQGLAEVTQARAALVCLATEAAEHAQEARSLRNSTSWRLTGPLRSIARHLPAHLRRGNRHNEALPPVARFSSPTAEPPLLDGEASPHTSTPRGKIPVQGPGTPRPTPHWPIVLPDLFALRDHKPTARIAAVVHVFYPELCDEVLAAVMRLEEPFDLFVTLVDGSSDHLLDHVRSRFPSARIWCFPNRGRDILPLVAIAATGALSGYELVCKIHTKRSPHRADGNDWRRHLIAGVLPEGGGLDRLMSAFANDPDLGIVVADGQIFKGAEFWDGNIQHLENLLPLLGYSLEQATEQTFAGGSIFWMRPLILRDIAGLKLLPEAFEPEPIGTDGSLAHAVERLFSIVCHAAGMRIEQASLAMGTPVPESSPPASFTSIPRVVAFYLPQFHPIPENDSWWGRGFTEWTNVTKAQPLFAGHRQPRLPGELGFTDLRLAETRQAQAALARAYGVEAFCYYYYWFGEGRRLLNRPLDEVMESGEPDFPFMICWANEPWSRNWDGINKEVLMAQDYPDGWVEAFARDVAPLLRDPRYVRLGGSGKPMLMVYRIMHLPNPVHAIATLRAALRLLDVGEVHLSAGWVAFGDDAPLPDDPGQLGLDSYFEFPPHRVSAVAVPPGVRPEAMTGGLYDYGLTVDNQIASLSHEASVHGRHRAVMMGWDNTARRGSAAHVFRGATPCHFRRWLRGVVRHEQRQEHDEERLVFVNAWNEWAEGTCLEPDRDFGRGWLEAVRSALGLVRPTPGCIGSD